jgi:hypothetical protein
MTSEVANREACKTVLQLLSDEETVQVNDPNAVRKLASGEEYLDLEQPIEGVQRLMEGRFPTGRVLPRRAVNARTWERILGVVRACAMT